jgi:hypothetical protein
MIDEVVQNTVTQEIANTTEVATPVVVEPSAKESYKEQNLREMRKRLEQQEAELQSMRAAQSQKQQQSYQQPEQASTIEVDDILNIADSELVEAKDLKKYVSAASRKQQAELAKQQQELQQLRNQIVYNNAERDLNDRYGNFKQVVTEENLAQFKAQHPEEFNSMMANPDVYGRLKTAYSNIVNYDIIDKTLANKEIDRRLEDNKSKPRSAAASNAQAANTNPLAHVGDFDRRTYTDAYRKQVLQNLDAVKRSGGR